jgi:GntR family transcriptional regulator
VAFKNSEPIYQQIIDDFKKKIIRGELQPGDKVPSQREFAEQARVNPNTVQRAYREMENMKMVETVRGQGTFLIAGTDMRAEIKKQMAGDVIDYFIAEMKSLGYSKDEMVQILTRELEVREGERA